LYERLFQVSFLSQNPEHGVKLLEYFAQLGATPEKIVNVEHREEIENEVGEENKDAFAILGLTGSPPYLLEKVEGAEKEVETVGAHAVYKPASADDKLAIFV